MHCLHRNRSRAWTVAGVSYVRCLSCGARRELDWKRLRPVGEWGVEGAVTSAYAREMTAALQRDRDSLWARLRRLLYASA